ncbi:DUF1707 and DUF4870 domain-containing protein [Microlunatus sp. Gsoil 973]|jgi:hypothetical protein|uniref:DUF1707 and DUF4870 domain-containing protein n=1 Tax=Microlunatus sp. Gsoil 973 TaxID=2672569 RepID=UPI0012B495AC|nr:DUF1707 and DUF4870 domain-containing protein [Microlunatus sp. Gsoil 973]QGN33298.1 DUF1707 domain-containing protein [Microlunatus sp. Gsoil 973]
MPASFEHPSLSTHVSTEQRDRAADYLKAAYAEGRISEAEFDRRIGLVLGAVTRKDLNEAFFGLVDVPPVDAPGGPNPYASGSFRSQAGYGYLSPTSSGLPVRHEGSPGGALAHFSGLFTSVLGPGIGYAVSSPGSLARRESAKAFNFQLVALIGLVIGGTLQGITHSGLIGFLVGLGWVAWVVLSIVGGVKAAQGEDWTNPVTKAVKLRVLPEK